MTILACVMCVQGQSAWQVSTGGLFLYKSEVACIKQVAGATWPQIRRLLCLLLLLQASVKRSCCPHRPDIVGGSHCIKCRINLFAIELRVLKQFNVSSKPCERSAVGDPIPELVRRTECAVR